MSEFPIGCQTMRDGIIVAAAFAVAGLLMLLTGRFLVPPFMLMDQIVQALGGVLLLFVPFILITTYLRTSGGQPHRA